MDVSIGIMAYNEEKNIGKLLKTLLGQNLDSVKEIIVVNDGSTDRTENIVKKFSKNKKIKLINLKKRSGKVNAINVFLKTAKSEILIIKSADTIPKDNAIKYLIDEFKDPKIGIVGAHAIPINKKDNFVNFFGRFVYKLHHKISLKNPKFGELIAFRKVISNVQDILVDEEYIAMLIKKKGYKLKYCPKAIFYNKQPSTLTEIIVRRRRYIAGHMDLSKKGYTVSTHKLSNVIITLIKNLELRTIHFIFLAILLEVYIRFLAFYDYYFTKSNYLWKIAKSTKKL